MKNKMAHKKMTTQKMVFFGVVSFILSFFVYSAAAHAEALNIMKDAEERLARQQRCEKSQERTEALVKTAEERLAVEAHKDQTQQQKLQALEGDDRASYLNFVIIDRSESITDMEGFLEKISRRLELVHGPNICTGIADNKTAAAKLIEASRKLQEKMASLKAKVSPYTND